jgi:hypothetical protein
MKLAVSQGKKSMFALCARLLCIPVHALLLRGTKQSKGSIKSLPAIVMSLPFVIPTQEGSRLIAILLYDNRLSFSTFCLDAKSGAKRSRQTRMAPPVLPANAQQHSARFNSLTN